MGMRRIGGLLLGVGALAVVAGCHKGAPSGQVVARVNGDEVTQTELGAELASAGVPASVRDKAGPAMLQRIVDRKLLAQAARKDGVDKDPTFVLLRARADETLLVQRYLQRQSQTANQPPGADEVEAYLREHPAVSDKREQLTLDQVQFPAPTDPQELAALQKVSTMDELIGVLRARGVQFKRDTVRADTAALPDELLASMGRLKPGEPLVVLGGPVLTAAVVTARQPVPTTPEQAAAIARQRIVAARVNKRLQQEDAALRQNADIQYAKGMAPPAKPKG